MEIYPAESRLVDIANTYHLFACKDPMFRISFGYSKRCVIYDDLKHQGLRQRSF